VTITTDNSRLRPDTSEVERLWADNTKARNLAGWQPEYAGRDGLRRGLAQTIGWFSDSQNLQNYKTDYTI
jgi:dTDP-glucose 4,6-dehydratase